ncbi:hypothetical protein [Empedobacter tilapiae]
MANIENQQPEYKYTEKSTLKNWFRSKLKPTQGQFWAWMDSYWHKGEKLPINTIDGLGEAVDGKAPLVHYHDQYATNDATSLSNENVEQWKKKLDVDNLQFNDQAISLTNEYVDFGLTNVSKQAQFNQAIYESNASKLKEPTYEGDSKEYPYLVGIDAEGYSAKIQSGDIGKNFANTDLVVTTNRKHTGTASVELGFPFICSNASVRYSGLVDKSADATYKNFIASDSSGNLGKISNAYNILLNTFSLMNSTQKLTLMKLMNGQYSSGQITTNLIITPIVFKQELSNDGVTIVRIIGANLLIDPDTSYVRIKEIGNTSNFSSCFFVNNISTELVVYVPNSFLQSGTDYIFEIKHNLQLHTTSSYLSCIANAVEYDLSLLNYTTNNAEFNVTNPVIKTVIDPVTKTISNSQIRKLTNHSDVDYNQIAQKIYTNSFASNTEDFVINFDINWGFSTSGSEVTEGIEDMYGIANYIVDNTVNNNIQKGFITGIVGNNSYTVTKLTTGQSYVLSGNFRGTIIKQNTFVTLILEHSSGATIFSRTTVVFNSDINLEFYFKTRIGLRPSIGSYKVSRIIKF